MTKQLSTDSKPEGATPESLSDKLKEAFNKIALLRIAALLVVGATFVLLIFSYQTTLQRYINGTRAVRLMHQSMLDQETGLRGYLFTGNKVYLEPYNAGTVTLDYNTNRAQSFLGKDPKTSDKFVTARLAQQAWLNQWAARASKPDAPKNLGPGPEGNAFLAEGKVLFDRYRIAEDDLTRTAVRETDSSLEKQRRFLVIGLLLNIFIFVAGSLVGRRAEKELTEQVVGPVKNLVITMNKVGEGDISARAEMSGPKEMQVLGENLGKMTASLAAAQNAALEGEKRAVVQTERLATILHFAKEVAGSLSLRYVLDSLGTATLELSQFNAAKIWLSDQKEPFLRVAYDTTSQNLSEERETRELGAGPVGKAARFARAVTEKTGEGYRTAVPMIVGARVVGVVEAHSLEYPDADTIEILNTLTAHAGTAIEATRLHAHTEELSQIDPLTGLLNRRKLEQDFKEELRNSRKTDSALTCVMLDVDHFKKLNDSFGHQVGDEVLQEVASVVCFVLRENDTAYRYGGEEICLILRNTCKEDGLKAAERVRAKIEERFLKHGPTPVTASLGVAETQNGDENLKDVVRRADAALYKSKHAGRNRVTLG